MTARNIAAVIKKPTFLKVEVEAREKTETGFSQFPVPVAGRLHKVLRGIKRVPRFHHCHQFPVSRTPWIIHVAVSHRRHGAGCWADAPGER